jgi:hypothetical protein
MTEEISTIEVIRYKDPKGRPTCAVDFTTKKVCKFYRTMRFGTTDTCLFAETYYKYSESQQKYDNDRGYLIPLDNCPVWNSHDDNRRVE